MVVLVGVALTEALPAAERRTLAGQSHVADPQLRGQLLTEFFSS